MPEYTISITPTQHYSQMNYITCRNQSADKVEWIQQQKDKPCSL